MTIKLQSTDFESGQPIPKPYTGDGQDLSPQLAWSQLPDGTRQLALICTDPDAPSAEPWVHWLLYNIPAEVTSIPRGVAKDLRPAVPAGCCQGKNSWPRGQTIGYRGPAPPPGHGVHHYHFTLYALDAKLQLDPGLAKASLHAAIEGHILARGELVGTYQR